MAQNLGCSTKGKKSKYQNMSQARLSVGLYGKVLRNRDNVYKSPLIITAMDVPVTATETY
jgi:hypothetical protein